VPYNCCSTALLTAAKLPGLHATAHVTPTDTTPNSNLYTAQLVGSTCFDLLLITAPLLQASLPTAVKLPCLRVTAHLPPTDTAPNSNLYDR
jgi:hypothetical protein